MERTGREIWVGAEKNKSVSVYWTKPGVIELWLGPNEPEGAKGEEIEMTPAQARELAYALLSLAEIRE